MLYKKIPLQLFPTRILVVFPTSLSYLLEIIGRVKTFSFPQLLRYFNLVNDGGLMYIAGRLVRPAGS